MKKTDEEIEKMLLNDLEEEFIEGWADTSKKSLLLELIRERKLKNNIVLPDFIVSFPIEKVNEARYSYASGYPPEHRSDIEEAHLAGQMFVIKKLGLELNYGIK